jgi:Sec-independent protein translocase protein TatA
MPTLAELGLILFLVFVVFVANRIPALGDALGHGLGRLFGHRRPRPEAAAEKQARQGG